MTMRTIPADGYPSSAHFISRTISSPAIPAGAGARTLTRPLGFSARPLANLLPTRPTLPEFVPGAVTGSSDTRAAAPFRPQASANLRCFQRVSLQNDLGTRAPACDPARALANTPDNMVNPTSAWHLRVPQSDGLPAARPEQLPRLLRMRSSIATGASRCSGLRPDDFSYRRADGDAGLRTISTRPEDKYGRDSSLPALTSSAPPLAPYENRPNKPFTARRLRLGLSATAARPWRRYALLQHHNPT